ncbi:hypothetical protein [Paenibacillus sp. TC-CSREp1]|uniref:hypothetical protein n=1 Tax=Paenibacillus sp. TC-CSREp1 TaxID=3410089 RepID=UPI003D00CD09
MKEGMSKEERMKEAENEGRKKQRTKEETMSKGMRQAKNETTSATSGSSGTLTIPRSLIWAKKWA